MTKLAQTALLIWVGFSFSPNFVEAAQAKTVTGTVKIDAALQKKISQEATLYVIARPEGITAGPPLAVKRVPQPLKFPVRFELSSQDAMMPGTDLIGTLTLTARIAQKGSAAPAQPGDILTSAPVNAQPGGKSVTLNLNEEKK